MSDILNYQSTFDGAIFKLVDPVIRSRQISFKVMQKSHATSFREEEQDIYLKILFKTLKVDNNERTMMRIIDVSDAILFDKT